MSLSRQTQMNVSVFGVRQSGEAYNFILFTLSSRALFHSDFNLPFQTETGTDETSLLMGQKNI